MHLTNSYTIRCRRLKKEFFMLLGEGKTCRSILYCIQLTDDMQDVLDVLWLIKYNVWLYIRCIVIWDIYLLNKGTVLNIWLDFSLLFDIF